MPVGVASEKEAYAARTIRSKINSVLEDYSGEYKEEDYWLSREAYSLPWPCLDITSIESVLEKLGVNRSVGKSRDYIGGEREGKRRYDLFIKDKLKDYAELRNNPDLDYNSHMSPYLHFGQISPLYLIDKIKDREGPGKATFIEELVIRRELAINYVFYNEKYDDYEELPNCAKETLEVHSGDQRALMVIV